MCFMDLLFEFWDQITYFDKSGTFFSQHGDALLVSTWCRELSVSIPHLRLICDRNFCETYALPEIYTQVAKHVFKPKNFDYDRTQYFLYAYNTSCTVSRVYIYSLNVFYI